MPRRGLGRGEKFLDPVVHVFHYIEFLLVIPGRVPTQDCRRNVNADIDRLSSPSSSGRHEQCVVFSPICEKSSSNRFSPTWIDWWLHGACRNALDIVNHPTKFEPFTSLTTGENDTRKTFVCKCRSKRQLDHRETIQTAHVAVAVWSIWPSIPARKINVQEGRRSPGKKKRRQIKYRGETTRGARRQYPPPISFFSDKKQTELNNSSRTIVIDKKRDFHFARSHFLKIKSRPGHCVVFRAFPGRVVNLIASYVLPVSSIGYLAVLMRPLAPAWCVPCNTWNVNFKDEPRNGPSQPDSRIDGHFRLASIFLLVSHPPPAALDVPRRRRREFQMNETNFDHFAISFDAVFVAEFQETFSDELFDCESRRVPHIFNVTSGTFFLIIIFRSSCGWRLKWFSGRIELCLQIIDNLMGLFPDLITSFSSSMALLLVR